MVKHILITDEKVISEYIKCKSQYQINNATEISDAGFIDYLIKLLEVKQNGK